jgi:hypothetical protein
MTTSSFLVAERDRMIARVTQRFMTHRTGGHVHELEVDHTPLASAPNQVVAIITETAGAVAQAFLARERIGRYV